MRKVTRTTSLVLLAVTVLMAIHFIVNRALFRDLWFDEALTFLNFAMLPDIGSIYYNYVIPNNQILFTVCLKYWHMLQPSFMSADFFMRLLPLILAGGSLWMISLWRGFYSRRAVYLSMAALALSLPFEIYAVALRGYMLSLFLLLLCINIALRFNRKPSAVGAAGYFLASLAAVATLPSNIVALGGIALWFMPFEKPKKCLEFRWWLLAAAPLAAMALFYLPILRQVEMVLALQEGWGSGAAAAMVFYMAFVLSFLPLLAVAFIHRAHWSKWLKIAGVVLLVLPFFLSRTPAPFPRVFFPYWAVLLLVLTDGLNSYLAIQRRQIAVYPVLAGLVCICALMMQSGRLSISETLVAGHGMDDYFYPSYARVDFRPHDTVRMLQQLTDNKLPPVYVSFQADFYPMIFYGLLNGIDAGTWQFDGPRSKVDSLPRGALVVLSNQPGELDDFSKRFGVTPVFIAASGFQRIYRIP